MLDTEDDRSSRASSLARTYSTSGPIDSRLVSLSFMNQTKQLFQELNSNEDYDFTQCRDNSNYTLIHIGCLNNNLQIVTDLVELAKKRGKKKEEITEWINMENKEKFTPIHLASFKGNIQLLELLESLGGNWQAKNIDGLNVLHLAAQGDQPVALAHFRKKGMNINQIDFKGNTPLHWATFFGMENAVNFLTSWKCSINIKSSDDGSTPLHKAVLSSNSRIVRRLIKLGANKYITDNAGRRPIDVVKPNDNSIRSLLKGSCLLEFLGCRPSLSSTRTRGTLMLFVLITILIPWANAYYLFPITATEILEILVIVFYGTTFCLFLLCWLKDPGYLLRNKESEIYNILLKHEPYHVCSDCNILRAPRSKHCDQCGRCVMVYDHHCPWLDNCIGARNHCYFLCFVFSIFTFDVALISYTVSYHNDGSLKTTELIIIGFNLLISVIFFIPLISLCITQSVNFFEGRTTSERYSKKPNDKHNITDFTGSSLTYKSEWFILYIPESNARRMNSLKDEMSSLDIDTSTIIEKKGTIENCKDMCCGNALNERFSKSY